MGQQDSKPDSNRLSNSPHRINPITPNNKASRIFNPPPRLNCQGLLKLQTTPFKNSIEIQTDHEILFLQHVDTTLKQLLEDRLHTNKLFTLDDIEHLIEAITFTLANLQEKKITYKDIRPEHIFYDNGNFKLLPNELIEEDTYQKLKQNTDTLPSPELIIALRCGEEEIVDQDILEKSNVFTLGMLLLETATLLPSNECYDCDNYDILDSVINERIILVEEYYGQKIARVVANMLDYDYTERMNLRDLSIWVNRLMAAGRTHEHSQSVNVTSTSMLVSKSQKAVQVKSMEEKTKSRVKQTKNNSVYMGPTTTGDCLKEDRNKVYIHEGQREENITRNLHDPYTLNRKSSSQLEKHNRTTYDRIIDLPSLNVKEHQHEISKEIKTINPYLFEDYKLPLAKKQGPFDRALIDPDTVTKRITKQPIKPFRNQTDFSDIKAETPLKEVSNQYYPSIDDVLKPKPLDRKPTDNSSVNRIKQQILKSRKVIQEFKRSEGLKF